MYFPDSLSRIPLISSVTPNGLNETWDRNLRAWVANIPGNIPGPYANDAAAAAAGVTLGQMYYQTSGTTTKLVARLT